MIRQEIIDRVRDQTDIVELIGSYLPLRRVGRNYRGLCPFHAERSPSFYVSPDRQSYHCFGCGAGGNVFSFVMAQEKIEFPEAVELLARRLGIRIERDTVSGRNRELYDALEAAASFFEQELNRSRPAKEYLASRGLSSDTIKRFRLGFAPGGNRLRSALKATGFSEELLLRAGLLNQRDGVSADYFYERLMFPVLSASGKVVGFSGRVLGEREPKYLNSPDTPVFHKGELLYGLFQAKSYLQTEPGILVEGNFDLLALFDRGIKGVVATLGTALTPTQAAVLRRYGQRLYVCYDSDEAGRKACRRSLDTLLAAGIDPHVIRLPEGMDPDSFIRREGVSQFRVLLEHAQDFVEAVLSERRLATVAEQRAALGELVGLLARLSDEVTRELYASRIAHRFRINKDLLLRAVRRDRKSAVAKEVSLKQNRNERLLVAAMLQGGDFVRRAAAVRLSDSLTDPQLQAIARAAELRAEERHFSSGLVIDSVDESLKPLVAELTFHESVPLEDFEEGLRRFVARRLRQKTAVASAAGDIEKALEFNREQARLCQQIVKERSRR